MTTTIEANVDLVRYIAGHITRRTRRRHDADEMEHVCPDYWSGAKDATDYVVEVLRHHTDDLVAAAAAISRVRELAGRLPAGEWTMTDDGPAGNRFTIHQDGAVVARFRWADDARYILAVQPQQMLALLERIEEGEDVTRPSEWAKVITRAWERSGIFFRDEHGQDIGYASDNATADFIEKVAPRALRLLLQTAEA